MTSKPPHVMSDAALGQILKHYDPITQTVPHSLQALEASIMSQIDRPVPDRQDIPLVPAWMLRQGWTERAVALASILIVALGFIVGQVSYRNTAVASLAPNASLLVLAGETGWQPAVEMDGDSDEDSE
jgi:hypothetical protein